MYIADENNHRIRKVTVATGIITTIAGTGSSSYSGDNGQASSAAVRTPTTVAVDSSGISPLTIIYTSLLFDLNVLYVL